MTIVELCRLVARAELRPFTEHDYHAFSGVGPDGPWQIAEVDEWLVVRDDNHVELLHLAATEDPTGGTVWALDAVRMSP